MHFLKRNCTEDLLAQISLQPKFLTSEASRKPFDVMIGEWQKNPSIGPEDMRMSE